MLLNTFSEFLKLINEKWLTRSSILAKFKSPSNQRRQKLVTWPKMHRMKATPNRYKILWLLRYFSQNYQFVQNDMKNGVMMII